MLKVTLRPRECVVVNGCVIRNSDRRHSFVFENHADIIREKDLIDESAAATPVSRTYYFVQTALIRANTRDKLIPEIQRQLAQLATCFGAETRGHIMEAATHVSAGDFYKALSKLRPVLSYEAELLALGPVHRPKEAEPGRAAAG
ncbi:flagellar biosynthesis repressor FlbT [Palleronia pelagia]|uniref:Flagellar protein FlbT n=1 Tax=Palleronia pelagia TaxID=387096 RepID=A0A1H8F4N5_9RHOB|nr:flagellar biosynthesis repressor FlbT [Palleronia pelagia]SEN25998.1 flagellar protein FlbT [Palleronia pelagia]